MLNKESYFEERMIFLNVFETAKMFPKAILPTSTFNLQIKLDITGDKGWQTDDMFIPPGYHMDAKVVPESKPAPAIQGQQPFTFPFGAGGMIMNGCFGSGYQPGDRCYDATWATTKCLVSLRFRLQVVMLKISINRRRKPIEVCVD